MTPGSVHDQSDSQSNRGSAKGSDRGSARGSARGSDKGSARGSDKGSAKGFEQHNEVENIMPVKYTHEQYV